MSAIIFGSPEAAAVLAKDREMLRLAEHEAISDNVNELAERLAQVEMDIESLEVELAGLEDERDEIKASMAAMERPDPKIGILALKKWNVWATARSQEQPPCPS